MSLFNTRLKMRKTAFIYKVTESESAGHQSLFIPVDFNAAGFLAAPSKPNHIGDLWSGAFCSFCSFRPACIFKFCGFKPSAQ